MNFDKTKFIKENWFLKRDIISTGYNQALENIKKILPIKIIKIPTGKKVWDWIIPKKWEVKQAFIDDIKGNRLLDLKDYPLHVLSYSLPINKIVSKKELFKHLHFKENKPNAIPFEFKYYQKDWGFCIQHNKLTNFKTKKYKVFIDSNFKKDFLRIGEYTLKGKSKKTIVIVAHLCHPCMVNDDLTGVTVLISIAKKLGLQKNYYTYKFLLLPETIGSIAYLSQNEKKIKNFEYGIFLEMLGTNTQLALQYSYQGNTLIDKIMEYSLKESCLSFRTGKFREIVGNDEMVFNGPNVNIPMVSISRYPYPEYHTSEDNPSIISKEKLDESEKIVLKTINILEKNFYPIALFKGTPFLSKHGLWVDWRTNWQLNQNIDKIILSLTEKKSVFEISQELNLDFDLVHNYIFGFVKKGLARRLNESRKTKTN